MSSVRPPLAWVVVLACALVLPAAAQSPMMGMGKGSNPTFKPGPGPDELWETTMKMEMSGMTMGGDTQQMCIKKGRKDADLVPKSDECTTTDVKTSGNRTTFSMVCKGDPPMSGTGDITSTPNATNGRMTMRSTRRGEEMTMTQTFSSKRIGTCTDTTEQFIAKVDADSKAMTAKVCAEQMEALEPTMFEAGSACAGQRKAFCDKVAALTGELREPAGHAAARRKYPGTLQRAFRSCGQDYAAATAVACGKAVAQQNWNFVGSGACDDQVRAHAPRYCNTGPNKSPDPQYAALCARYAALTRGTATSGGADGAAPGAPAAQSAAPKPVAPDPAKSSLDAVRKLLPF
jgi:hypothetical protein